MTIEECYKWAGEPAKFLAAYDKMVTIRKPTFCTCTWDSHSLEQVLKQGEHTNVKLVWGAYSKEIHAHKKPRILPSKLGLNGATEFLGAGGSGLGLAQPDGSMARAEGAWKVMVGDASAALTVVLL